MLHRRAEGRTDPHHLARPGLKAVLARASPQVAAVHPLGTFEVEEEVGLLQHAFSSQILKSRPSFPTFAGWLMTHDQHATYEYMVVLLKIISWFRNDPRTNRGCSKRRSTCRASTLLHVFPNAKLVCSHRDPIKCVSSICSTAWNAMVRDSDMTSRHSGWDRNGSAANGTHGAQNPARARAGTTTESVRHSVCRHHCQLAGRDAGSTRSSICRLPTEARSACSAGWTATRSTTSAHKYSLAVFGLDTGGGPAVAVLPRALQYPGHERKNPHLAADADAKN
ncbi:MAG: sulfotransferase [Haliea sp.]|nr:sulfotransferase [Haliea sp.]